MVVKQFSGSSAPDGSQYVALTDGAGNLAVSSSYPTPATGGVTAVATSSGNVAAAIASATLAAVAGKTNYLSGFMVTGAGATAGNVVNGTITGLLGGTQTFTVPVSAGIVVGNTPIVVNYNISLPASAANVAIVVSVPSLGLGNTNSAVSAWGYQV